MKIAYIITRSDVIGGANVHLLDLAEGMKNKGHDVSILIGGEGIVIEQAKKRNLNCISVKSLVREINFIKDLKCYLELKKQLIILNPDIVHLHSSKAGILGRLVAWRLKVPHVFTAHGWAFTEGVSKKTALIYRFIEKMIAKTGGKIITVSDYDRNLALKNGVSDSEQMITVHNGINIGQDLSNHSVIDKAIRIIMVARFDIPKNYIDAVKALNLISDLNWKAEFVGDGPLLQDVQVLTNQYQLQDKITFSGQCHDVSERLHKSDIFLLISNWEGLPLTILEAMGSGLPVVASDVGGVKEAVWDNENGYLIPRNDIKYLSDKLRSLIENEGIRLQMGLKGREIFESHFTYDLMLDKTLNVYRRVLKKVNEVI